MADKTGIEWTDATWNIITGCSVLSPGCAGCYAMDLAGTRLRHHPSRAGLTTMSKAGPVWNGQVRFNERWIVQPLRWKAPRRIFVCAHGDLFHENVPDVWIDVVFAMMALNPRHTFQALTKRAERMRSYMAGVTLQRLADAVPVALWPISKHEGVSRLVGPPAATELYRRKPLAWPLPNVWLGVSVEDQRRADERIPPLLMTPAAKRFLSCEPLLGQLDVEWAISRNLVDIANGFLRRGRFSPGLETLRPIDWVIVGGESGPNARPMHEDWARSLRDQCTAAGVPFFFKQWGEWIGEGQLADLDPRINLDRCAIDPRTDAVRVGKRAAGAMLDGREWREFPA